jgi:hypothetical protein
VAGESGFNPNDSEQVTGLAAVAVTRLAWRDGPVEDWHSVPLRRITDAEMMRTNAAMTRAVRGALNQVVTAPGTRTGGNPDPFARVSEVLAEPTRRLPDGRTVADLAPDPDQLAFQQEHVRACCHQWDAAAGDIGLPTTLRLLACHAAIFTWRWWQSTGWSHLVAEFVAWAARQPA